MLYQIFTEDTGRENITRILDRDFQGYTLIPANGRWQGIPEPSLIAEIETTDASAVKRDAELIRKANRQQAVLVEEIPSHSELVTALDNAVGETPSEVSHV